MTQRQGDQPPERHPEGRWLIGCGGAVVGVMTGLVVGLLLPGAQWWWLCPLLAVLGWWGLPRLVTK